MKTGTGLVSCTKVQSASAVHFHITSYCTAICLVASHTRCVLTRLFCVVPGYTRTRHFILFHVSRDHIKSLVNVLRCPVNFMAGHCKFEHFRLQCTQVRGERRLLRSSNPE